MEMLLNNGSRKCVILIIQVLIVLSSFAMAYLLRFDLSIPENYLQAALWLVPPLIVIKLAIFWRMGLFSGWWRYVSLPDLLVVLRASAFGSVVFAPMAVAAYRFSYFPRSVLILDGMICFLLMGGVRVSARMLREKIETLRKGLREHQTVLVVGAGGVGQTFVREIHQNPHLKMSVAGLIDSDPERQKMSFQGIPVLGTPRDLPRILARERIDQVIIAQTAVGSRTLQKIVETCRRAGVQSKILPAVGTILSGEVSIRQIRDVQVEDLLGRPQVHLDIEGIRNYLAGKRILVTGAAGSIGSEICRQITPFDPAQLILFDHAETPLFEIENELREVWPGLDLVPKLGDIRNRGSIRALFAKWRPAGDFSCRGLQTCADVRVQSGRGDRQ